MKPAPEKHRFTNLKYPFATDETYGNNGYFIIPHPRIQNYLFICIISDSNFTDDPNLRWEHVSVSLRVSKTSRTSEMVKRCPTWEEMCWVKDQFWHAHEAVMQLHPPANEYVNNHPYCLHLWRPLDVKIPLPPAVMVGLVGGER